MSTKSKATLAVAACCAVQSQAFAAGFIEDSKASFGLRNFYYSQDTRNKDIASQQQWGQGFIFDAQSGYTQGDIGFGLDALVLSGFKLDDGGHIGKADASRIPSASGLFPTDDGHSVNEFSSVGVTGKVRYAKSVLRYGELQPILPVIWRNDGRLLPQTFNGWQLESQELDSALITLGRLDHAKGRASSDQTGLSTTGANGVGGKFVNQFYYGGVDYRLTKNLKVQYYFGSLQNFYWQDFFGLTYDTSTPIGKMTLDLRYFVSRSDGKNSSASGRAEGYKTVGYWHSGDSDTGEVDNRTASALVSLSNKGHEFSLGYQAMYGDSQMPYLDQGNGANMYLFTQRIVYPFNNAGENAWMAQYNYDFAGLGVPGLKSSLTQIYAFGAASKLSERKETESDIEIFYAVQSSSLKGVGVAWRRGIYRSDLKDRDITQDRFIISYTIPLK